MGDYYWNNRCFARYAFGSWNTAIEALVVTMLIDYASGVIAAYLNPHLALNSQRGFVAF